MTTSQFTLTGKATDTAGAFAVVSGLVIVQNVLTVVDGEDILNNPSLVGCPAGQALTVVNGDFHATAGSTYNGMHITGSYIPANNSMIKNSQIDENFDCYPSDPLVAGADHCNIGRVGVKSGAGNPGLEYGGGQLSFCNIAGFSDGAFLNNGNSWLDACWIHGILQTESTAEHNDLMQMSNGTGKVTRCLLDRDDKLGEVSCMIAKADNGPITGLTMDRNLFRNSGGASGCQALIWHSGAGGGCSGGVFTNNKVEYKVFSIVFNSDQPTSSYVDSGNVWWTFSTRATMPMTWANGNVGQKIG